MSGDPYILADDQGTTGTNCRTYSPAPGRAEPDPVMDGAHRHELHAARSDAVSRTMSDD